MKNVRVGAGTEEKGGGEREYVRVGAGEQKKRRGGGRGDEGGEERRSERGVMRGGKERWRMPGSELGRKRRGEGGRRGGRTKSEREVDRRGDERGGEARRQKKTRKNEVLLFESIEVVGDLLVRFPRDQRRNCASCFLSNKRYRQ